MVSLILKIINVNQGGFGTGKRIIFILSLLMMGCNTGLHYNQQASTHLVDYVELRRYFNKGNLEITPVNYSKLAEPKYSEALAVFDKGVIVKGWKASLGSEPLEDLLFYFSHIKSFKFNVVWDQEVDFSEFLSRVIQFYENLEELDVLGCHLTDAGMNDIISSIVHPEKLRILNVCDNSLSEDILKKIQSHFNNLIHLYSDISLPAVVVPNLLNEANIDAQNKLKGSAQHEAHRFSHSTHEQEKENPKEGSQALYEQGLQFYNGQDYVQTKAAWEHAGSLGNAEALYGLGYLHQHALGVLQDYTTAKEWFEKAATLRDSNAEYSLGYLYHQGLGVLQSNINAKQWYEKAAAQGNAEAQKRLEEFNQQELKTEAEDVGHAQYELGQKYYDARDYHQAKKCWEKAAVQGNLQAQIGLGNFYYNGKIATSQDYRHACKYYTQAAEQGDTESQYRLGEMYFSGQGMQKDRTEAKKWYEKAALQGHCQAQYKLGELYRGGQGVLRNDFLSIKWWRKAAAQGHVEANQSLQEILSEDKVCSSKVNIIPPQTTVMQAPTQPLLITRTDHKDSESSEAQYNRAREFCNNQDYDKAKEWFEKAAAQGYAAAQNELGAMYENGRGVIPNVKKAFEFYTKAADQGHADAQANLGNMYRRGLGVRQDLKKAFKLYTKAADQNNAEGQNLLGFMYSKGHGVRQNVKRAFKFYTKAADQGHADAMNNLGTMYENGRGIPKNFKIAAMLYEKSVNRGSIAANYNLANLYKNGHGVPLDLLKAKELYKKAADHGDKDAQREIRIINQRLGQSAVQQQYRGPQASYVNNPQPQPQRFTADRFMQGVETFNNTFENINNAGETFGNILNTFQNF